MTHLSNASTRPQWFDSSADAYDAWYESATDKPIMLIELDALRPLVDTLPSPRIEVGVGTGRFAEALGFGFGLDPSQPALTLARRRGVAAILGQGEALPLGESSFGTVVLAFTLCFLANPTAALVEAHRILADGGGVVVGFLPAGSAWADPYAKCGRDGHHVYRYARFYTVAEVERILLDAGFALAARRSTLRQPPGLSRYRVESADDDVTSGAGFVAISAVKLHEESGRKLEQVKHRYALTGHAIA